jgi:hypothetical protein
MKHIEKVYAVCNTSFSDPPYGESTPSEYFQQMFRYEVIKNVVQQSSLYCPQKTGRPVNTNENKMEQFLGIHIMIGTVNMPSYRTYWADWTRFDPLSDITSRNRRDILRN